MSVTADKGELAHARAAQNRLKNIVTATMEGTKEEFEIALEDLLAEAITNTVDGVTENTKTEGRSLLHIVTASGKPDILKYLLDRCENGGRALVNLRDSRGFTPLMNAVIAESDESIDLLLSRGAQVDLRNNDGAAAVHFVAADGNVPRLEKLVLEHNAKLNVRSSTGTPLHWAAGKGRPEMVKRLLELCKDLDVNNVGASGVPPVVMAAVAHSEDTVVNLIAAGANPGYCVAGDVTVLHICAEQGQPKAVKAIVATPVGRTLVDAKTADGNTPLVLAAMSAHKDIVEILLPLTTDKEGVDTSLPIADQVEEMVKIGQVRLAEWHEKEASRVAAEKSAAKPAPVSADTYAQRAAQRFSSLPEPSDADAAAATKATGNTAFAAGDFNTAIAVYEDALKLNRADHTIWSNRSAALLKLARYEEALIDAECCRRVKPDWVKGCYRLAAARLAMNLYEDSAVAAFEGLQLDSTNEELKSLMNKAVRKGKAEFKKSQSPY